MRRVTYAMNVSLDGYIAGPDGSIAWGDPDDAVFRYWLDRIRTLGAQLLGRRLYEAMLYWETAEQEGAPLNAAELEWAARWRAEEAVLRPAAQLRGRAGERVRNPESRMERTLSASRLWN